MTLQISLETHNCVIDIFSISSHAGSHSAVMTSSIAGHVICPSAVVYANSASTLTDHTLSHDNRESLHSQKDTLCFVCNMVHMTSSLCICISVSGCMFSVPQMFLTSPNGTVQIPVSAVPLHSVIKSNDALSLCVWRYKNRNVLFVLWILYKILLLYSCVFQMLINQQNSSSTHTLTELRGVNLDNSKSE